MGTETDVEAAIFEGSFFFEPALTNESARNSRKRGNEMMSVTEQLIRRRPGETPVDNDTTAVLTDTASPADAVFKCLRRGPTLVFCLKCLSSMDDEQSVAVCL
jgi:hypothetical protein